jgi:hypothetical protein
VRKNKFEVPRLPEKIHSGSNLIKMSTNCKMSISVKQEPVNTPSPGCTGEDFMAVEENSPMMQVKVEEGSEFPKMRKRMCRKMLNILTEEFNIEKKDAKKLTISLEGRFNL